jgi:PhnB protein
MAENDDKVIAKAIKLGAKPMGTVMDMFWGDRVGTVLDPDGNTCMVSTHMSEPTPQEMKKRMIEAVRTQAGGGPNGTAQ